MRSLIPSFLLLLISLSGFAQVRISGVASHEGKPLDGVTIDVIENGERITTLAATKRGQYSLDFPLDRQYRLIFRRSTMIPVQLEVNTHVELNKREEIEVEVPLNMELFYHFDGLDISAYEAAIGEIRQQGTGVNTFGFFADAQVINKLKEVNERSLEMEERALQPTDVSRDMAMLSATKAETKATSKKEYSREELNKTQRVDRAVERFNKVEEGQLHQASVKRDQIEVQSEKAVTKRAEQEDHVFAHKDNLNDYAEEQKHRERAVADAKVVKQSEMLASLEYVAAESTFHKNASRQKAMPVKKSFEDGWFATTELLLVREYGVETQYEKVAYDMMLFKLVYFYRNKEEISEESYASVARLFQ